MGSGKWLRALPQCTVCILLGDNRGNLRRGGNALRRTHFAASAQRAGVIAIGVTIERVRAPAQRVVMVSKELSSWEERAAVNRVSSAPEKRFWAACGLPCRL